MRVLIDVDGVCANLVDAVLDQYNYEYKDNLKYENINVWNMETLFCDRFGKKIDYYFEDINMYKKVKPIWRALDGVLRFRAMGHEVVFVSSGFFPAKVEWLQKNGFLSDYRADWHYSKEVIVAGDKSMIVGDIMIDDKPSNLIGHYGILFDQPWNRKDPYPIRALDWQGVVQKVRDYDGR
mgnify:CR=1 FL=1